MQCSVELAIPAAVHSVPFGSCLRRPGSAGARRLAGGAGVGVKALGAGGATDQGGGGQRAAADVGISGCRLEVERVRIFVVAGVEVAGRPVAGLGAANVL